jgi:hypothetical protein
MGEDEGWVSRLAGGAEEEESMGGRGAILGHFASLSCNILPLSALGAGFQLIIQLIISDFTTNGSNEIALL